MENKKEQRRDDVFDALKGIAIILVIMGHCGMGPLHAFIFSFHVPVFFFVAGFFLKSRPLQEELFLSFKRLVVPYLFCIFCIFVISAIRAYLDGGWADVANTKEYAVRFLLGYKGGCAPNWLGGEIRTFWFILAMFWSRFLALLFLNKIKSEIILCAVFFILCPLGAFCGEHVFVPYCIPLGITAVGFVYVGYLVRRFEVIESLELKYFFPLLLILWFYNWRQGGIDMALFWYPSGYVFGLLGALGAFFVLYFFCKNFFVKGSFFWKMIRFCGRYSLIVYCIHAIDENLMNWKMISIYFHVPFCYYEMFQFSVRMVLTILLTFFILKVKPLREMIFQIKKL